MQQPNKIVRLPLVTIIVGPQESGKSRLARFLANPSSVTVENIVGTKKAICAIELYIMTPLIITTLSMETAEGARDFCVENKISHQVFVLEN